MLQHIDEPVNQSTLEEAIQDAQGYIRRNGHRVYLVKSQRPGDVDLYRGYENIDDPDSIIGVVHCNLRFEDMRERS